LRPHRLSDWRIGRGRVERQIGRQTLVDRRPRCFRHDLAWQSLASNFSIFIAWRIFGGRHRLASNLSPMYIAEVAPAQIRGQARGDQSAHTVVIRDPAGQYINWFSCAIFLPAPR